MPDLYDRLEQIKQSRKIANKDLGEIIGMTEGGFRQAIKRKNLKPVYIELIAKELGVRFKWLAEGEGSIEDFEQSSNEKDELDDLQIPDNYDELVFAYQMLWMEKNTWKEKSALMEKKYERAVEVAKKFRGLLP